LTLCACDTACPDVACAQWRETVSVSESRESEFEVRVLRAAIYRAPQALLGDAVLSTKVVYPRLMQQRDQCFQGVTRHHRHLRDAAMRAPNLRQCRQLLHLCAMLTLVGAQNQLTEGQKQFINLTRSFKRSQLTTGGVIVAPNGVSLLSPNRLTLLCTCRDKPVSDEPITIATPFDLDPRVKAHWGVEAFQYFFNWVNTERGGVCVGGHRRPVVLKLNNVPSTEPNQSDVLTEATKTLLDEDIKLFMAPINSGPSGHVAAAVHEAGDAIMMATWASDTQTVFAGRPQVFGTLNSADQVFKTTVEYMTDVLNVKTVGLIEEMGSNFSKAVCISAEKLVQDANIELLAPRPQVSQLSTDDEIDQALDPLQVAQPDVIIACTNSKAACEGIVRSFVRLDFNPKAAVFAVCLADVDSWMGSMGDDGRFVLGTVPWLPKLGLKSQKAPGLTSTNFGEKLAATFHSAGEPISPPPYQAASTWAGSLLMIEAMEYEDTTNSSSIAEYLRCCIFLKTMFGTMSFDPNGQSQSKQIIIQILGNGTAKDPDIDFLPPKTEPDPLIYPMPHWKDRRCHVRHGWNPDGMPERSIWGFANLNESGWSTYFPDSMLYGESGPNYTMNIEVTLAASMFARLCLDGFIIWMQHENFCDNKDATTSCRTEQKEADYTRKYTAWNDTWAEVQVVEKGSQYAKSVNGTKSRRFGIQQYMETILMEYNTFSYGSLKFNILIQQALAFYTSADRSQPICTPCPANQVAVWDDVNERRVCKTCAEGLRLTTVPSETNRDPTMVERYCQETECDLGYGVMPDGTCEICPAGEYGNDLNQCLTCAAGSYTLEPAQTECTQCATGTASDVTSRTTVCDSCIKGTSSSYVGETECTTCQAGHFATTDKATVCELCPLGKISTTEKSTACTDCLKGHYSIENATWCEDCPNGEYQNLNETAACKKMAEGALANGDGQSILPNAKTYWVAYKAPNVSWERCPFHSHGCLDYERCAEGSTGVFCSSCIPGYTASNLLHTDAYCFKCPPIRQNLIITGVVFMVVSFFFIYITGKAYETELDPQDLRVCFFKEFLWYAVLASTLGRVLGDVVMKRRFVIGEEVTDIILGACHGLMFMSGTQALDNQFFSVTCLAQEFAKFFILSGDWPKLNVELSNVKHSQWFDDVEFQPFRDQLAAYLYNTELYLVLGWAAMPIIAMVPIFVFSWLMIQASLTRNCLSWRRALRFYDELCDKTAEETILAFENDKSGDKKNWPVYCREYGQKLMGIWLMIDHAAARRYCCCLSWPKFFKDTFPILFSGFYVTYPVVIAGLLRPTYCMWSRWEHKYRRMYASELICGEDGLTLASIGCTLVWGYTMPLLIACYTKSKRKSVDKSIIMRMKFNLLLNGYTDACWWWELVLCVAKTLAVQILYYNTTEANKNTMMLIFIVLYGSMVVHFKPHDIRCDRVLAKVHGITIVVSILHCVGVDIISMVEAEDIETDDGAAQLAIVVSCIILLLHLAVILHLFYRIYRCMLSSYFAKFDWYTFEKDIEEGKLKNHAMIAIRTFFLHRHETVLKQSPYLYFDPLFGWAIAVGSGGDAAEPVRILRGHNIKHGRPLLSHAAGTPEPLATTAQKEQFQRMLNAAMQGISARTGSSLFSVSLMEFTIRAGITLARGKKMILSDKFSPDHSWADFEDVVDKASAEMDFLNQIIVKEDEETTETNFKKGQKVDVDCDGKKRHAIITKGMKDGNCSVKFEDDRSHERGVHYARVTAKEVNGNRMDVSKSATRCHGHFVHTHDELMEHKPVAKAFISLARSVREQELNRQGRIVDYSRGEGKAQNHTSDSASIFGAPRNSTQITQLRSDEAFNQIRTDEAPIRQQSSNVSGRMGLQEQIVQKRKLHELRVEKNVTMVVGHMFHPLVYARGINLSDLQLALMELVRLPKHELILWLDTFEDHWVTHNKYEAYRIKRYGGNICDIMQQTEMTGHRPSGGGFLWEKQGPENDAHRERAKMLTMTSMDSLKSADAAVAEVMDSTLSMDEQFYAEGKRSKELQVGFPQIVLHGDQDPDGILGAAPLDTIFSADLDEDEPKQQGAWGTTWVQDRDTVLEAAVNWARLVIKAGQCLSNDNMKMDIHSVKVLLDARKENDTKLADRCLNLEVSTAEEDKKTKELNRQLSQKLEGLKLRGVSTDSFAHMDR